MESVRGGRSWGWLKVDKIGGGGPPRMREKVSGEALSWLCTALCEAPSKTSRQGPPGSRRPQGERPPRRTFGRW